MLTALRGATAALCAAECPCAVLSGGLGSPQCGACLGASGAASLPACGHVVVRINLSEQSDLMELLGTDLPVEGAPPGTYAWQDGAFLAALKAGHWVILDELNLAPQSVLESVRSNSSRLCALAAAAVPCDMR